MKFIPSEFKEIKPLDIIILIIIITIAITALYLGFSFSGEGEIVEIVSKGSVYHYNLNVDQSISIDGDLGEVVIEIKNGKIRMLEDQSPRQIGVKTGWVSMVGLSIICLPCKVSATIVSANEDKDKLYDSVVE